MPAPVATDENDERRELGAQFFRLSRALIAAETPLLAAQGIDMWDYVVLTALSAGGAPTQLELARVTRRDKTRLIGNLDALERAGLLSRRPDPADRRARIVEISPAGAAIVTACRKAIRHMEDDLLADFSSRDRDAFLRVLGRLTRLVIADL